MLHVSGRRNEQTGFAERVMTMCYCLLEFRVSQCVVIRGHCRPREAQDLRGCPLSPGFIAAVASARQLRSKAQRRPVTSFRGNLQCNIDRDSPGDASLIAERRSQTDLLEKRQAQRGST